jgi:hypothetical protein
MRPAGSRQRRHPRRGPSREPAGGDLDAGIAHAGRLDSTPISGSNLGAMKTRSVIVDVVTST